jgi:hypothetical protein
MGARQGKIARAPLAVREELNRRLLEGQLGPEILPWLNGLAEMREYLGRQWNGAPITDNNLSEWRLGGFEDWRLRRERLERTRELSRWSVQLAKASGGTLAEGAATILGGHILEVLEGLAGLLEKKERVAGPDGADGADGGEAGLGATAEAIEGLTRAVASLRRGDQGAEQLRLARERLAQQGAELALARDRFERETCEKFLAWHKDARAREIAEGPASNAEKIAALRKAFFADVDELADGDK